MPTHARFVLSEERNRNVVFRVERDIVIQIVLRGGAHVLRHLCYNVGIVLSEPLFLDNAQHIIERRLRHRRIMLVNKLAVIGFDAVVNPDIGRRQCRPAVRQIVVTIELRAVPRNARRIFAVARLPLQIGKSEVIRKRIRIVNKQFYFDAIRGQPAVLQRYAR